MLESHNPIYNIDSKCIEAEQYKQISVREYCDRNGSVHNITQYNLFSAQFVMGNRTSENLYEMIVPIALTAHAHIHMLKIEPGLVFGK